MHRWKDTYYCLEVELYYQRIYTVEILIDIVKLSNYIVPVHEVLIFPKHPNLVFKNIYFSTIK